MAHLYCASRILVERESLFTRLLGLLEAINISLYEGILSIQSVSVFHGDSVSLSKLYAFLLEQCCKTMQHKIELWQDYDKHIVNSLIKLLETIREHALSYQDKNTWYWL
jgi:hypothetical protein